MIKGEKLYDFDTGFPLVVTFIVRSLEFVEMCDLTGIKVLYTEMVSRIL